MGYCNCRQALLGGEVWVLRLAFFSTALGLRWVKGVPRVYVVQNYVAGRGQLLVEKTLGNDFGLLLLVLILLGPLFVVQWDALSLHEVVVQMHRQHLWIWDGLFVLIRQNLVVNVVLWRVHVSHLSGMTLARILYFVARIIFTLLLSLGVWLQPCQLRCIHFDVLKGGDWQS